MATLEAEVLDADARDLRREIVEGPPGGAAHEATRAVGPHPLDRRICLLEDHQLPCLVGGLIAPASYREDHDRLVRVRLMELAQGSPGVHLRIVAVEDALVRRDAGHVQWH